MDLSDRHIMFGLPSYDGRVVTDFDSSYARTAYMLNELGVKVDECRIDGGVYIDRARDEICHVFLQSEATHLMFIDADMGWEPEHIVRLLRHDKEICCGMYCRKDDEPIFSLRLGGKRVIRDGLILAQAVPAGFLLINKSALVKLKSAHPELLFNGTNNFEGEKMVSFFHMYIDEKGDYLREDMAFGMRWSDIEDGIWIDPAIQLRHWDGKRCYQHNFLDYLKTQNLKFAA
jgi:hypothetical protein